MKVSSTSTTPVSLLLAAAHAAMAVDPDEPWIIRCALAGVTVCAVTGYVLRRARRQRGYGECGAGAALPVQDGLAGSVRGVRAGCRFDEALHLSDQAISIADASADGHLDFNRPNLSGSSVLGWAGDDAAATAAVERCRGDLHEDLWALVQPVSRAAHDAQCARGEGTPSTRTLNAVRYQLLSAADAVVDPAEHARRNDWRSATSLPIVIPRPAATIPSWVIDCELEPGTPIPGGSAGSNTTEVAPMKVVSLIGRMGHDPDRQHTANGTSSSSSASPPSPGLGHRTPVWRICFVPVGATGSVAHAPPVP